MWITLPCVPALNPPPPPGLNPDDPAAPPIPPPNGVLFEAVPNGVEFVAPNPVDDDDVAPNALLLLFPNPPNVPADDDAVSEFAGASGKDPPKGVLPVPVAPNPPNGAELENGAVV